MSLRPPLVWIPQSFGATVFDRRNSRYYPFDHETAALLRDSIDRPFMEFLTMEQSALRRESLIGFYEYFSARGYFTLDHHFAGVALTAEKLPEDRLLGPLVVHLELVAACNLS